MALGEEAEVEASVDPKAPSYLRWSCSEQEVDTPAPVSGEQPPRLEAEEGPTSSVWRAERLPAPAHCGAADPGDPSGNYQLQADNSSREPVATGSKSALSRLLFPAAMGTGELLHSVGSQMEETRLSASEELPQTPTVPRAIALCSGHDAKTEDDPSPLEFPRMLDLRQQPHVSGFPPPSRWRPVVSPGATAPHFSSYSISASSADSSLQGHQEQAEPQNCSLAKVASSSKLVSPQLACSVVRPGPQLQRSPQAVASKASAPDLGRRHLSFQAEYWACVLPDSLPPSPDRQSPLWNPDKEYEDLLDYTYPLRPKPPLPKHLDSRVLADPVLQDSGVDLTFSVSPASTLKSPTNVSHNCPPMEVTTLPFSGPPEPDLKQGPSGVSQKQDGLALASCSQLTSTPRALGSRDIPWENREPGLSGMRDSLPSGKHLRVGSSRVRTWNRGGEMAASRSVGRPPCTESGWKSAEVEEGDDEYLALPTRLRQVSSLVSYLGSVPTLVTLPTRAAEGQSSLDVSDSDGPASLPSDSSQNQLPSGAALRGSRSPEGQKPCFPHSFVEAADSAGEGHLVSSQALGAASGPLRTHSSLPATLDLQAFSDPDAGGQLPRKERERGKESLLQCMKTFCCQLEELICWLYKVADFTDHLTAPQANLTVLKSSLQLYRQFKKDIDEHQSLTESVLQKGEILLQCLLDNTPVLKDVLRRISKQPSEMESHADHLYDSILASLDMLAGCTLIPDNAPMAHRSANVKEFSLASSQAEI